MESILNFKGEIKIHQNKYGYLKETDKEIIANGKFIFVNNVLFIEVIGESPFIDFSDARSQFHASLKFVGKDIDETFKLTILPDPEMYEFEVIQNEEYKKMLRILMTHELRTELNEENKVRQNVKNKKV